MNDFMIYCDVAVLKICPHILMFLPSRGRQSFNSPPLGTGWTRDLLLINRRWQKGMVYDVDIKS